MPLSRYNSDMPSESEFDKAYNSIHSTAAILPQSTENGTTGNDTTGNSTESDPKKDNEKGKPPEEDDSTPPETVLIGPFELVKEKVMAVPGLIRLLAVGLLLIMFICSIAGKGATGASKFQIFCWVLFTPATLFFSIKDFSPEGAPEMLSSKF